MEAINLIILERTISEKTSIEIQRIIEYLPCSVVFKELPDDNQYGFGYSNPYSKPMEVASITSLPQPAFEANLLHELYHLCQYVEKFPTTSTKIVPQLSSKDQAFLDVLGSVSASMVLDLDVCDRISALGLSSGYFFDIRYKNAMSYNYGIITDRDSVASMIIRLAGIILQNSKWQSKNVLEHYQSKNPYIVQRAKSLATKIKKHDHSTPEGCFKCLAVMYEFLDIWDWQIIQFHGQQFFSNAQVNTFLSQCHLDS